MPTPASPKLHDPASMAKGATETPGGGFGDMLKNAIGALVSVRDRVIHSYEEIMKMPI